MKTKISAGFVDSGMLAIIAIAIISCGLVVAVGFFFFCRGNETSCAYQIGHRIDNVFHNIHDDMAITPECEGVYHSVVEKDLPKAVPPLPVPSEKP